MKYTVENNDYGSGYIVHFEDDSYALVNTQTKDMIIDDAASLMSMGFWADDNMKPVSEEEQAEIAKIIEANL